MSDANNKKTQTDYQGAATALADLWKRDIAELKRTKPPGWEAVCAGLEDALAGMRQSPDVPYGYPNAEDIRRIFDGATGVGSPAWHRKNRKRREEDRFMQADAFAAGFVLGEGSVGTDEASLERFCEILEILGYEVPDYQKLEMLVYAEKMAEVSHIPVNGGVQ